MISDKDKEAFDKWCVEKFNIAPELIEDFRFSFTHKLIHTESAWQAALEYKEAEIIELKKKVQRNIHNSAFNGLLAENKKLREALEFYANSTKNPKQYMRQGYLVYNLKKEIFVDGGKRAREALKEVDLGIEQLRNQIQELDKKIEDLEDEVDKLNKINTTLRDQLTAEIMGLTEL